MAKVYDALRRAEEERRKLSEPPSQTIARLDWEPEDAASPSAAAASRPSLFRRLWPRRIQAAEDTASDFNKRRIALLQPDSYVAEQFRALRGRIDALETPQRRLHTIAVTSAVPGEGKTTASSARAARRGRCRRAS